MGLLTWLKGLFGGGGFGGGFGGGGASGPVTETVTVGGKLRKYHIWEPKGEPSGAWILALHPMTLNGKTFMSLTLSATKLQAALPGVGIIAPDGIGARWAKSDVPFIAHIVGLLEQGYGATQVDVVSASMGSQMMADSLDAGLLGSARRWVSIGGYNFEPRPNTKSAPVMLVLHSPGDTTATWASAQAAIEAWKGLTTVEYGALKGGHIGSIQSPGVDIATLEFLQRA
jgi:poly(3-hydroxybutyrate) depolymerase